MRSIFSDNHKLILITQIKKGYRLKKAASQLEI